jgi:hypothetical protein
MDTSIGARVVAKGAGAHSDVRGRIAQVKLRGQAAAAKRLRQGNYLTGMSSGSEGIGADQTTLPFPS